MKVRDQMNREVLCTVPPRRIISLVPSQTEFLFDLGLENELVGITKFCIHPDSLFRTCERVGGTKQLDIDKIRRLQPDLIIGNKEENTQEQIELLEKEFPVWLSDVNSLQDAIAMMHSVSEICGKVKEAEVIIANCEAALCACKDVFKNTTALYLMWYEPWMGVAPDTFIHQVLVHLGFNNVLENQTRYPVIQEEVFEILKPDFCLLSSEPFPFADKHRDQVQKLLPESKILFVDGEMFSWYGSRLVKAGHYFLDLSKTLR